MHFPALTFKSKKMLLRAKNCYYVQKRTAELVRHVNLCRDWFGLGARGILSKRYNRTNTQIRPEWGGNTLQSYPRHIQKIKWGWNTNLNESWHRIILFLQAKCVCVCDSSLPGGDILVMPQLSNSQDVWNYCVKFCATLVQSFPEIVINCITLVPQHTHCLEKHPENLGSTP